MYVSEDRCCQGCLENQLMASDWWDFPGLGASLESLSCCFPASLTPGGWWCGGTVLDLQPQNVGPCLFPSHPSRPADSSLAGLPHLPVPRDSAPARPSHTHHHRGLLASAALWRPPSSCHSDAPALSWTPLCSLPEFCYLFSICAPPLPALDL